MNFSKKYDVFFKSTWKNNWSIYLSFQSDRRNTFHYITYTYMYYKRMKMNQHFCICINWKGFCKSNAIKSESVEDSKTGARHIQTHCQRWPWFHFNKIVKNRILRDSGNSFRRISSRMTYWFELLKWRFLVSSRPYRHFEKG